MEVTRVALVTGAARGVGAETVSRLVGEGYHVMAVDRCQGDDSGLPYALATPDDLDRLAETAPEQILTAVVDVRDRQGLEEAVAQAVDAWGRLDVVVAAAAVIAGGKPLWETDDATLELLWEVNVRGVWNTAAATIPAMLAGPDPQGCRFIAIASAAATRGVYRLAAYTTSKHAVAGIVRGLAADLVGTGMTAVAVSPGATDSAMLAATSDIYDLDDPAQLAEHQLLRRMIRRSEIADLAAWCASPSGAVLNGSIIDAGGGFGS